MSVLIIDKNGVEVEVFLEESGGMIDVMLRAETETDWIEGAVYYGLLIPVEGQKELTHAPGVEIDAIGSVVVTPGTYDKAGKEITPPVVDPRYHVNLRLHGVVLEKFAQGDLTEHKWKQMAKNWALLGADDAKPNKDERGKSLARVTAIDPTTIKTRMRVYL